MVAVRDPAELSIAKGTTPVVSRETLCPSTRLPDFTIADLGGG